MEFRRFRTSHWKIPLAEAVLLQCITVSVSHAIEPNERLSSANASKDTTSIIIDNIRQAQLGLDSYNTEDDAAELDLYLDVTLNQTSSGLVHFVYREDQLWADADARQQLGFIVPPDSPELMRKSLPDLQIDSSTHGGKR